MRPNILLVCPDLGESGALASALASAPYRFLRATDVGEAMAILASLPVAAVICDARLPSGTGLEFLTAARARHPNAVRMLVSERPTLRLATRAINEAGVSRFLGKPCDPRALADALRLELGPQPVSHSGRLSLIGSFEAALARVWLATQPIVDFREERVVAYEALARSDEPGLTSPDQLFALAKAVRRERDLDHTLWARAALLAAELPDGVSLFVNVEYDSLNDPGLFDAKSPLAGVASKIVLELTEHGHVADLDVARSRVLALKERGFRVAIDDFGAGQSGLNVCATLAPDVVKFDIGLVRGIEVDSAKARFVHSMCAACDSLGIDTIAEGVENIAQVESLGAVKYLQGYLFAPPGRPFPRVTWPEPKSETIRVSGRDAGAEPSSERERVWATKR